MVEKKPDCINTLNSINLNYKKKLLDEYAPHCPDGDSLCMIDKIHRDFYIADIKKSIFIANTYNLKNNISDGTILCNLALQYRKYLQDYVYNDAQFYFITVNFKDDKINVPDIPKLIELKLKKVYIDDWIYIIEQREEDKKKPYKGFHVHILFKTVKHKKYSEVKKEMKNTFKPYVGNPQHVDVKKVYGDSTFGYTNRLNYCLGLSKRLDKQEKIAYDQIFRVEYGFQQYYTNNSERYKIKKKYVIAEL